MNHSTHITTFYSFKGGVGRTLLLVNVGVVLALKGRRVLLWDLDVEAPGMHLIPAVSPKRPLDRGFLEWLFEWQEKHRMKSPNERLLNALTKSILPVPGISHLDILPAFGDKADRAGLYQDIRWSDFMVTEPERGLELLRAILTYLSQHPGKKGVYDHILMDARTGMTDLGGLMSAVLPHATVLVGSYGAQNLAGLVQVYKALQPAVNGELAERLNLPNLQRLVVVSPVPPHQEERRAARQAVWDVEFPLGQEETRVEVPFDSRLLFTEEVLALTDAQCPTARSYQVVADRIDGLREMLLETREQTERAEAAYPEMRKDRDIDARFERGRTFEDRIAKLLSLLGYRVEREQLIDGNRVDLIAGKQSGLRSECYLVECKEHARPVGKGVIEKLHAWLNGNQAREMRAEGMVVATAFSPQALTFANQSAILAHTPEDLEKALFDFGPYLARLRRRFEESPLARTYVPQRVLLEEDPKSGEGEDLLAHALKWAGGNGRRLWLLLGDYGTGKTAFFKRFSYELARLHLESDADGPGLPIPIAIDLKEFPNAISLEGLLLEHLRVNAEWPGNPEILLYLLAAGRVILLLDAFDEMGTAAVGRSIEEQFRQLAAPAAQSGQSPRGNRVLITCRTHFFRDQQYVKDVTHCGAPDDLIPRDSTLGLVARSFDASIDELLLFNGAQIRQFLNHHLPAGKVLEAEAFIRNTYDLPSLAPRPVLLEMIIEALPELMKAGEAVTPAGLYHRYTSLWLEQKAGGSLQTTPQQRKLLLETLAFELWGRPSNRIHYHELTSILEQLPAALLAGLDPGRVDLELRTAAFLTRTGDGHYGFSHKSFREFFYAQHLLRSLRSGPEELSTSLRTAPVTPECCTFLADLIEPEADRKALRGCLRTILERPYQSRVSENALRLAYHWSNHLSRRSLKTAASEVRTLADYMRSIVPPQAQLQGAQLRQETFKGAWLEQANFSGALLDGTDFEGSVLCGAVFRNASLVGCRLNRALCRHADFSDAVLENVDAHKGDFQEANLSGADLTAAVFVLASCRGASFLRANCHAVRFAKASLGNTIWDEAITIRMTCPDASPCPLTPSHPATPEAFLRLGHYSYQVDRAIFSPDGQRVLTASDDKTARIWDAKTGAELIRFEGHCSGVRSAVFSADGQRVLTASDDKTARIWDAKTGAELIRFEGHCSGVRSAVFSADGQRVLTASDDKTARIWDAKTGAEVIRFEGHGRTVNSAVFSADGQRVLTASDDKTARIWDAKTGAELIRFEGHGFGVRSAVFSADGQRVLTASSDNTARIWDAEIGAELIRFEGHGRTVNSAVFSADGQRVLTASDDKTARIWDAEIGAEIIRFEGHGWNVNSAVFSADGQRVLTASSDNTARIWDAKTGAEVIRFEGHGNVVMSAVFSADGQRVLTASSDDTAKIWDAKTGAEVIRFEGHDGTINSAVFSADGQRVLTASSDHTARIWDAKTGAEVIRFEGHGGTINSAVFSADGQLVATASYDKTARIWDAKTGAEVVRFEGHDNWVNSAVFSADGQHVATASSDHTARIWDAKTGAELIRFEGHGFGVGSAVFSPDGQRVLTASYDKTARIWDVKTGAEVVRFEGHDNWVNSAVFSPDGQRVLTASPDNTARIWDAKSGAEVVRFEGHGWTVNFAVFSADGQRVLTASSDHTARIWDAQSGRCLRIIAPVRDGWLTLDERCRYRAGGRGLESFSYVDPTEQSLLRTLWHPEDLPWMAEDYEAETRGHQDG